MVMRRVGSPARRGPSLAGILTASDFLGDFEIIAVRLRVLAEVNESACLRAGEVVSRMAAGPVADGSDA